MASTLPVALHYARSDALKDSRHSPLPLVRLRPRAAPEMGGHILAQKRGHKVCQPTVGGHGSGLKKETKKMDPKKSRLQNKTRGATPASGGGGFDSERPRKNATQTHGDATTTCKCLRHSTTAAADARKPDNETQSGTPHDDTCANDTCRRQG